MEKKQDIFNKIIPFLENKEFSNAKLEIKKLQKTNNPEAMALGDFFLGYIYEHPLNPEKNIFLAKEYLLKNINSEFPFPTAYALYAQHEEDNNIAINYLKMGLKKYPKYPPLYQELLRRSIDKMSIIQIIWQKKLSDKHLLCKVIEYLIKIEQWSEVEQFILRLQTNQQLSDNEDNYLNLLKAYSLIFQKQPKYEQAEAIFSDVIDKDINNNFYYSHYLGQIFCFIHLNKLEKAKILFDRIPLGICIQDLDDGPYYPVYINFEKIYKKIFNLMTGIFAEDTNRKNKVKALYALYLFYPSLIIDSPIRYKKTDTTALKNILKNKFNKEVASALFNMNCELNQYEQANHTFWQFLLNHEEPLEWCNSYDYITTNASEEEIISIFDNIINQLKNHKYFDKNQFFNYVFPSIVLRLCGMNRYQEIVKLSDFLPDEIIFNSECAFECAFSYAKENHIRALGIYAAYLKNNPEDECAWNNLGLIFEEKDDLTNALSCFEESYIINPTDDLYKNNIDRIQSKIKSIQIQERKKRQKEITNIKRNLSLKHLEDIGYTDELKNLFTTISDQELRNILLRDLKECAIAVAMGQDKSATILCGSIIEALLYFKIQEHGYSTYDISEFKKNSKLQNYPIKNMSLNDLLYVADKENILCKNNFHLSHYIRDYRNTVHPSKEVRNQQPITHEKIEMMWTILKQVITELLKQNNP